MRLALKAQSQCRATLETLALINNVPVVFARQANVSRNPYTRAARGRSAGAGATAAGAMRSFEAHQVRPGG
jgi:hypothetical protein